MWRFKKLLNTQLLALLLISEVSFASGLGLHFQQWNEELEISDSQLTREGLGHFNVIALQHEQSIFRFGLYGGQALGQSQDSNLIYNSKNIGAWGINASVLKTISVQQNWSFEFGPAIKYLQVDWPTTDSVSAKSPSELRSFVQTDIRAKLNSRFDLVYGWQWPISHKIRPLWSFGLKAEY